MRSLMQNDVFVLRRTGFLDWGSKYNKTQRFGNWICFRPQVRGLKTTTLLGPLERANLNQWASVIDPVIEVNSF
jgi:hypothetical protein